MAHLHLVVVDYCLSFVFLLACVIYVYSSIILVRRHTVYISYDKPLQNEG